MSTIHRSRSLVVGLATVFAFTLLAPGVVSAQEEVADTAQQEEVAVLAPVAAPAAVGTSAASVRAVAQALAAQDALLSGELGSLQEERLRAIVAAAPVAAPAWDETSGYGAVETSRATIGYPATSTTQVPGDVRWAPTGPIGPQSASAASRARSADYLPVALGTGMRSESAHLATIALPAEAVSVNPSDNRILNALFGDQSSADGSVPATCTRTSTRTCTQR